MDWFIKNESWENSIEMNVGTLFEAWYNQGAADPKTPNTVVVPGPPGAQSGKVCYFVVRGFGPGVIMTKLLGTRSQRGLVGAPDGFPATTMVIKRESDPKVDIKSQFASISYTNDTDIPDSEAGLVLLHHEVTFGLHDKIRKIGQLVEEDIAHFEWACAAEYAGTQEVFKKVTPAQDPTLVFEFELPQFAPNTDMVPTGQ